MPKAGLLRRALAARDPGDRATRFILIWTMIVGVVFGGLAFAYKVAEFIFAMSAEAVKGAFDVPVLVYFAVAGGWFCLLFWCVISGRFGEMERAKHDMLLQEEEYERLGI